jgi:hypothetical protein
MSILKDIRSGALPINRLFDFIGWLITESLFNLLTNKENK